MSDVPTLKQARHQVEIFNRMHPELEDPNLIQRFPYLRGVVHALESVVDSQRRFGERPNVYSELGVRDTRGFVELLKNGDEQAVKMYKDLADILKIK